MRRLQSLRTRTNALESALGYAGSTSEVKCCCRVFRSSGVLRRSSKVLRRAAVWGRSKGPPPASKLNGIPMFPRAAVKAPCLGVPSRSCCSGRPHQHCKVSWCQSSYASIVIVRSSKQVTNSASNPRRFHGAVGKPQHTEILGHNIRKSSGCFRNSTRAESCGDETIRCLHDRLGAPKVLRQGMHAAA